MRPPPSFAAAVDAPMSKSTTKDLKLAVMSLAGPEGRRISCFDISLAHSQNALDERVGQA
jgi:hypothetical protein